MMKQQTEIKPAVRNINKPAYIFLLMGGIYFLIQNDFSQAVIFWGLALAFDPFQTDVSFKMRPLFQQIWLLEHLSITLALCLNVVWE